MEATSAAIWVVAEAVVGEDAAVVTWAVVTSVVAVVASEVAIMVVAIWEVVEEAAERRCGKTN